MLETTAGLGLVTGMATVLIEMSEAQEIAAATDASIRTRAAQPSVTHMKNDYSVPVGAASRVRLAAVVIFVVGWLAAVVVFALAPADGGQSADEYRVVGGQAYAADDASSSELRQLERLGGKAAVLTFKFNRWLTSLWAGRPLAYTLAVLSLLVALGCLHVAGLMMEVTDSPS